MDRATSLVVLFLFSIAATLALSAGAALHACRCLLDARGRAGVTAARALLAGLAGGAFGALVATSALALIPPIRRSWDSIAFQVALPLGAGLLLGSALGCLFFLVLRGLRPLRRAS